MLEVNNKIVKNNNTKADKTDKISGKSKNIKKLLTIKIFAKIKYYKII